MAKTSYQYVKFECTDNKCCKVKEILHQVDPWADSPTCDCGADMEPVYEGPTGECNVAFKGLSTPGSQMSRVPKMNKKLEDTWRQKRIDQVKKTGK